MLGKVFLSYLVDHPCQSMPLCRLPHYGLSSSHSTRGNHISNLLFNRISHCSCDRLHDYFRLDYHFSSSQSFHSNTGTLLTGRMIITSTTTDSNTIPNTRLIRWSITLLSSHPTHWTTTNSPLAKLLPKGNVFFEIIFFEIKVQAAPISRNILIGTDVKTLTTKNTDPTDTKGLYSSLTSNLGSK